MFTSGVLWLMTLALPWKQFGANADWCQMRWVGPPRGSKNLYCISIYLQRGKCGRGGQTGRQTDKHIHTHTHVHKHSPDTPM